MRHESPGAAENIAQRLPQIISRNVKTNVGCAQPQSFEKDTAEIIVVILPRMSNKAIKASAAALDDRRQPYDLGTGPDHDQKAQSAVAAKGYLPYLLHQLHIKSPLLCRYRGAARQNARRPR